MPAIKYLQVLLAVVLAPACGSATSARPSSAQHAKFEQVKAFSCAFGTGLGLPGGSDISLDLSSGQVQQAQSSPLTLEGNAMLSGNTTVWFLSADYLSAAQTSLAELDLKTVASSYVGSVPATALDGTALSVRLVGAETVVSTTIDTNQPELLPPALAFIYDFCFEQPYRTNINP